jgi:hypothetical protein
MAAAGASATRWARARHQVGGDRGDAAPGELAHALGVGERIEQADQRLARPHLPDLVVGGRADLDHEVAVAPQRACVGLEAGAGGLVVGVAGVGAEPGAALHRHREALRDQARDDLGRERDPSLAVSDFLGNGDPHGTPFLSGLFTTAGRGRR